MQVQALSHISWERACHNVRVPKYRRKVQWSQVGIEVGKTKGCGATAPSGRRALTDRDRTLWACGYYMSAVGLNETVIRQRIRNQKDGSKAACRRSPSGGVTVAVTVSRGFAARVTHRYAA